MEHACLAQGQGWKTQALSPEFGEIVGFLVLDDGFVCAGIPIGGIQLLHYHARYVGAIQPESNSFVLIITPNLVVVT